MRRPNGLRRGDFASCSIVVIARIAMPAALSLLTFLWIWSSLSPNSMISRSSKAFKHRTRLVSGRASMRPG